MKKNAKTIIVLIFMAILVAAIFLLKRTIQPKNIQLMIDTVNNVDVKVTSNQMLPNQTIKEVVYSMNSKDCYIHWEFKEINFDGKLRTNMRLRFPYPQRCSLPFKNQIKMHQNILNRAFQDWDIRKVDYITTNSFKNVNPSLTWNKRFIKAALKSEIVRDYKMNYPNQKSKLSSNAIFVKIANEINAYKELKDLFFSFGAEISLKNCEKVFSANGEKIKEFGIDPQKTRTIFYDAGIMNFHIINN